MTAARHKAVVEKPKGLTRKRLKRVVLPALAATAVTGTAVGVSLAATAPDSPPVAATRISSVPHESRADIADRLADREQVISRSARRVTIEEVPEPKADRFTTVALNVREKPSEDSKLVTTLDAASKIAITGETKGEWAEVVYKRRAYWVAADYLAHEKPKPEPEATSEGAEPTTEPSPAECTATPPSGVQSGALAVFHLVCANFPSITTYGGYRADGEHSSGKAIDIMVSGDLGWQVAEFLRAHAAELNLYDVIYSQKIWTPERASEGWRWMEDRGSTTANHYDHVHVSTN